MKICFWGSISEALKGKTDGGGQLQMALFAKALARGGHEVVVIDFDTPEDFVTEEGIKVIKIAGWNQGVRVLRTFTHRFPQLYRYLKEQNADIYYCRIRDFRHIIAYWAARKVKAKFVLGLASDLDAMNFSMRFKHQHRVSSSSLWSLSNGLLIELVYPFLLHNADLVLVQHGGQKEILANKNIRSKIFYNLIDPKEIAPSNGEVADKFIYAGSLDRRKGFLEFFDLVKKTPQFSYKIAGQPRDKTAELLCEELKNFKNVSFLGRLSHSETIRQISHSRGLISTSPMEGFPNIFLEAWACGIPVFSLHVDPHVIEKEKLGTVAHGNLEVLIGAMEKGYPAKEFATHSKNYIDKHHLLDADRILKINCLLNDLLCGK